MKLYLAATAPGNEIKRAHGMLLIPTRLLSYYLIKTNGFDCGAVFTSIKKYNENQNKRPSRSPDSR